MPTAPPESYATTIDITWAGYFIELATEPNSNTQILVQTNLTNAITWLTYAKNYFTTESQKCRKYRHKLYKLIDEVSILITNIQNSSNAVPIETDPSFPAYKTASVLNLQSGVGSLYLKTWRLFLEMSDRHSSSNSSNSCSSSDSCSSSSSSDSCSSSSSSDSRSSKSRSSKSRSSKSRSSKSSSSKSSSSKLSRSKISRKRKIKSHSKRHSNTTGDTITFSPPSLKKRTNTNTKSFRTKKHE